MSEQEWSGLAKGDKIKRSADGELFTVVRKVNYGLHIRADRTELRTRKVGKAIRCALWERA
jgi:hypothetical protein